MAPALVSALFGVLLRLPTAPGLPVPRTETSVGLTFYEQLQDEPLLASTYLDGARKGKHNSVYHLPTGFVCAQSFLHRMGTTDAALLTRTAVAAIRGRLRLPVRIGYGDLLDP
jgi:hypothetical protein